MKMGRREDKRSQITTIQLAERCTYALDKSTHRTRIDRASGMTYYWRQMMLRGVRKLRTVPVWQKNLSGGKITRLAAHKIRQIVLLCAMCAMGNLDIRGSRRKMSANSRSDYSAWRIHAHTHSARYGRSHASGTFRP